MIFESAIKSFLYEIDYSKFGFGEYLIVKKIRMVFW